MRKTKATAKKAATKKKAPTKKTATKAKKAPSKASPATCEVQGCSNPATRCAGHSHASKTPKLDALRAKLAALGEGHELSDGGLIEAEEDGTIRRRDVHGNTEDVVRLGESPDEEWQTLADFLDLTPADFDVEPEEDWNDTSPSRAAGALGVSSTFGPYVYTRDGKPLAACPACKADLTTKGGIKIAVQVGAVPFELASNLDASGKLVDVDDMVKTGHHCGTRCGQCAELLIDLDGIEESGS